MVPENYRLPGRLEPSIRCLHRVVFRKLVRLASVLVIAAGLALIVTELSSRQQWQHETQPFVTDGGLRLTPGPPPGTRDVLPSVPSTTPLPAFVRFASASASRPLAPLPRTSRIHKLPMELNTRPPVPVHPSLTLSATPRLPLPAGGPFRKVALLLMFNSADFLGNLAVLERWYAPHFGRIVAYCDMPGSLTAEDAAAAVIARGVPDELVSRVTFVHSGIGILFPGGVTRSDIAGGSYSQVALAHFLARLLGAGELAESAAAVDGVFFLCDDALLSPLLLSSLSSSSLPILFPVNEAGRLIDLVGQGRDRAWSWWRMAEGQPRMRAVMADPAMREFAPAGDVARIEWVGGYSDYVYIPRRFLASGRLQRCLELMATYAVFNEIAIPTCIHLCVMPVPQDTLTFQSHKGAILWGEERNVIDVPFIERALQINLVVHPVKLGRLSTLQRERLDKIMVQAASQKTLLFQ